jgi:hypothetical protein
MATVKKGDLPFHGDPATIKQFGANLSSMGIACAIGNRDA